jgi:hypothetical protein
MDDNGASIVAEFCPTMLAVLDNAWPIDNTIPKLVLLCNAKINSLRRGSETERSMRQKTTNFGAVLRWIGEMLSLRMLASARLEVQGSAWRELRLLLHHLHPLHRPTQHFCHLCP